MKKLINKTIQKKENKYPVEKLISWYIDDLEEFYPHISKKMEKDRAEIKNYGEYASNKLTLAIMQHCAYKTENVALRNMLTPRYVGTASVNVLKSQNAELIFKFVDFITGLKAENKLFSNMNIDYKKYSKAIAETENIQYNRYWMETYDEYLANYEFLLNSGDAESACFLAKSFKLSTEDFKKCQDTVLKSNNAELCTDFAENKGANLVKLRRTIIASGNPQFNLYWVTDKQCTESQANKHLNAIYNSTDNKGKLRALVLALIEKPELLLPTQKEEIVKNVIKSKNEKLAELLLSVGNDISRENIIKLKKLVKSNEQTKEL